MRDDIDDRGQTSWSAILFKLTVFFSLGEGHKRSVMKALNEKFPTKYPGELTWFMRSEYTRDRKSGTLPIPQKNFVMKIVDRFHIARSSLIPDSSFVRLRNGKDKDAIEGVRRLPR